MVNKLKASRENYNYFREEYQRNVLFSNLISVANKDGDLNLRRCLTSVLLFVV
jgi:hypothetical protein